MFSFHFRWIIDACLIQDIVIAVKQCHDGVCRVSVFCLFSKNCQLYFDNATWPPGVYVDRFLEVL